MYGHAENQSNPYLASRLVFGQSIFGHINADVTNKCGTHPRHNHLSLMVLLFIVLIVKSQYYSAFTECLTCLSHLYQTSSIHFSHLPTFISQYISSPFPSVIPSFPPPPPPFIAPSKSRWYKYLPAWRRLISRGISIQLSLYLCRGGN